jgi:DNA-binding beta-propeller fold protein YncE
LNQPHSIALDGRGGLLVADIGNHRIRRVDLGSGQIESVAGTDERRLPVDGQVARGTPVLGPRALSITNGTIWVALREGHSVWRLGLDRAIWTAVAGTGQRGFAGDGGPAGAAQFDGPKGVAAAPTGEILVVDTENHAIRAIDPAAGTLRRIAGSGAKGFGGDGGPATAALLDRPHGICVAPDGNVYIGDTLNHRVRRLRPIP